MPRKTSARPHRPRPQRRPKKAQSQSTALARRLADVPRDSGFLGIDPDLRNTAWAVVCAGKVTHLGMVRVPKTINGQQCALGTFMELFGQLGAPGVYYDIILIEGQLCRQAAGAETKNPQSLVDLAACAGAASGAALAGQPTLACLWVPPHVWKGTVPKEINQARTCRTLGWDYETKSGYVVPDPAQVGSIRYPEGCDVKQSDWKHLMDAIGIALWGWSIANKKPGNHGGATASR